MICGQRATAQYTAGPHHITTHTTRFDTIYTRLQYPNDAVRKINK